MPILNEIGYSTATCIKQTLFTRIINRHIFIASKVIQKNKTWCDPFYRYYDINAGNGYNQDLGLYGSPLYFANEIIKFPQSCKALFIEKNEENANSLLNVLHNWLQDRTTNAILDNNGAILDQNSFSYQFLIKNNDFNDVKIESTSPIYGLVYHDPNGLWDADYLSEVSKKHKYLDLLINCNATSFKRCHSAYNKASLLDSLLRIKKSSWLISKPRGKMQWCFLMGANISEKCFAFESEFGLVPIKSAIGQRYWEQVSLGKSEIERESPLFDSLPKQPPRTYAEYLQTEQFKALRQKRVRFANGLCEVCKQVACRDAHHICYVDWQKGEIDSLANIVMLCRACHRQIHNHSSLPDYDLQ